jgi:ribosomal protein S18 acetylase RimI-like enzyme
VTRAEQILLSDLNYWEAMRDLSRRAGGTVVDEDGLLLYTGGHPLPVLMNGCFRTDTRIPPAQVLARAERFFARHGRGYTIVTRAHVDQELKTAAEASGLLLMGDMPDMVLDHRLPDATLPAGVELVRVTTEQDAKDYGWVQGVAYATYGMPEDVLPASLPLDALHAPHIVAMLARVDGKPAAGAMVVVTHGVAGIYWVGTTPEARGKGLAELCTRAAGNAGFDRGACIAALQASPMGEPVYKRMGYVEVSRYPYLVQMTPPAA